jgi:hypothetical protein
MHRQTQMLVTGRPRATNGRFLVMHGDLLQLASELGTVTAAPHAVPLPSGSYVHGGAQGHDVARVWLTPADFAALCSCVSSHDTVLTISRSGTVVTAFSFAPVQAPLHVMSQAIAGLQRRMDQLDPEALRADIAALRDSVDELVRRLPRLRNSEVAPRANAHGGDEPIALAPPSSKRAG